MSEEKNPQNATTEEVISSVNESKRPGTGAKVFLGLAIACVLLVGLASVIVSRYGAQRRQQASATQAPVQATTASSAGAQPLKVTANAAGTPPVAGGLQPKVAPETDRKLPSPGKPAPIVPALDPDAADVPPIAVHALAQGPGSVAGAANGGTVRAGAMQALPDPLDAPILLLPAPPIGAGARAPAGAAAAGPAPNTGLGTGLDDAMAQTRARLDETRLRLEQQLTSFAPAKAASPAPGAAKPAAGDDGLKMSSTARVGAARLLAPSLTLPRGVSFTCALANKIVSEQTGPASCVVARNVYGHDGRVLLIERGAHLDGAYRAQVKVGQTRVAVVWERLRLPNGVVVDLGSPATGPLGEAGVDGFVDNHWPQRIGAALLLSVLDDAVKIEIAREQAKGNASGAVVLQGSGSETSALAGKVLDSTINIAPTIVKNQGELVAVSVAQDIDFSTVYELHASKLP